MRKFAVAAILSLVAGAAVAHPGHGAASEAHWLTEGDHLLVVVLVGALVGLSGLVALGRAVARRKADA